MAKDPIKKASNGTYYFRTNLGYHPITKKQIQKDLKLRKKPEKNILNLF